MPDEPFKFLSDSEFRKLSLAEKNAYIQRLQKHLEETRGTFHTTKPAEPKTRREDSTPSPPDKPKAD